MSGGLGFGSGFAAGLMQAVSERRQRRREDENKASEQNWRKFQVMFPVAFKEGQETGDYTMAEQLWSELDPGVQKKMKKEGSPFSKLGAILGMGGGIRMPEKQPPFISEEGAFGGASSPSGGQQRQFPPVVNTQARPATPAEQSAAPGAPTQIETAAVPWQKRPTFLGHPMSTAEERAERARQMDRAKMTGDIRTRRDVGSTELGLAGRDLQEFAATGDISALRQASASQPGSLASQILLVNEERAKKGLPPMTSSEVGEFRTKYEAQNDTRPSAGVAFNRAAILAGYPSFNDVPEPERAKVTEVAKRLEREMGFAGGTGRGQAQLETDAKRLLSPEEAAKLQSNYGITKEQAASLNRLPLTSEQVKAAAESYVLERESTKARTLFERVWPRDGSPEARRVALMKMQRAQDPDFVELMSLMRRMPLRLAVMTQGSRPSDSDREVFDLAFPTTAANDWSVITVPSSYESGIRLLDSAVGLATSSRESVGIVPQAERGRIPGRSPSAPQAGANVPLPGGYYRWPDGSVRTTPPPQ